MGKRMIDYELRKLYTYMLEENGLVIRLQRHGSNYDFIIEHDAVYLYAPYVVLIPLGADEVPETRPRQKDYLTLGVSNL